jgi:hypothetical protein
MKRNLRRRPASDGCKEMGLMGDRGHLTTGRHAVAVRNGPRACKAAIVTSSAAWLRACNDGILLSAPPARCCQVPERLPSHDVVHPGS